METQSLTMVRIYLTESEHQAGKLLEFLHRNRVRDATLLRGISGFGQSGVMHKADWMALSGDLPLVLEFMDRQEVVEAVLPELLADVDGAHVLRWPVECLAGDHPA